MIHDGDAEARSKLDNGLTENGSRRKHEVPPLRFAPVGMTDLFREFVGHHTSKRRNLKQGFMKEFGFLRASVSPW
jgi:hypothetical protein